MSVERIEADYLIETAYDPAKAVEVMAGEQSSGTFVPVPGETPELKARSAARVEKLEVVGEVDHAKPARFERSGRRRASRHRAAQPCPGRSRISDRHCPISWRPSPAISSSLSSSRVYAFSTSACRDGVCRRLSGTEIRRRGHTQAQWRARTAAHRHHRQAFDRLHAAGDCRARRRSLPGGIDFIKDDELQSDGPGCPFEDRAREVMRVIERRADAQRSQDDVCVQPDRRDRRDASATRSR